MSSFTITVELYGGPSDGWQKPLSVREGTRIPEELPEHPGYGLRTLRNDVWPARPVYYWEHPHTGHKRDCGQAKCGRGCPSRRAEPR
jgi:hypothetical protein